LLLEPHAIARARARVVRVLNDGVDGTPTMHRTRSLLSFAPSLAALAAGAALLAACTSAADFEGTPVAGTLDQTAGGAGARSSSSEQCSTSSVALAPEDPATFPKCACAAGGAARCVPTAKVPSNVASQLEACSEGGGGVCVPDKLVASGGAAPKTCNSAFGEGRCMSMCVPDVAKNAALLNRGEGDVCDADERCVPCLNPLENNAPTGVCEIGAPPPPACTAPEDDGASAPPSQGGAPALACPYTGPPVVDVTTFPACGAGARCVPASLVPASAAALLGSCPTGLCAPEKQLAAGGQYLPKTCAAVGGGEGRCTNVAIPAVAAQKAMLSRDTCDADELCAPCFNPLDGTDTGACRTVSCDAPKQPPKTFTGCCTSQGATRAKCVPTSIIPSAEQGNLDDDDGTCEEDEELCVPNEMLQPGFKGPACSGSTLLTGAYTGVCLSDCLHFGFLQSLGISRGSCPKSFKCAPCENPLTGAPTNAPGCPGT
jgi:hypothetical protein